MKRILILLLLLSTAIHAYSQKVRTPEVNIEKFIEEVFPVQDADLNYEELYESLLLYYNHPLDLNYATRDELRSLFILSELQINSLVTYREKYGRLLTIYELQSIPDYDLPTIYRLLPFVKVRDGGLQADSRSLLKRILDEDNNYLLMRYERTLETKKGYKPNEEGTTPYLGSPDKMLMRFKVSHTQDFSLGFTAEKDAGEPLEFNRENKIYGADFYSFHFQLQNRGRIKNIIIGDYQVQFGQSLLLAAGFNVGKGAETITTTRRSNLGIRPYTSVLETNFMRGAAATYELNNNIDVTAFYSRLEQDASLQSDTSQSEIEFINSISITGMHRTSTERAAKKQVMQQTAGGNITYHNHSDNLQLGFTFVADQFSTPIAISDKPYKRFDFSGSENHNTSFSYNYTWQNIAFFGEIGRSKSGGTGGISGMIASLTSTLETSLVLRSYSRDFHSFHGRAFGESIQNNNEKGWYWGLKYVPSRRYQFTAYFDRFSFPWLKYRVDAPSSGHEYLVRATMKPSRAILLSAQFRQEAKSKNPSDAVQTIKSPAEGIKNNYVFNLNYSPEGVVSLKSRVQVSDYRLAGELTKGYAIVQDLNLQLNKFKISTRFAIFDTEDYENRQYAYERDVLYAFSIPPYNGRGTRQYVLLQYGISRKIDFWIRYARTHYRDRDKISTGYEQIDGNIKTDFKVQTRIKF